MNFEKESLIYPSKLELRSLDNLVISCQYFQKGCILVSSINTYVDMIKHEKICEFRRSEIKQKSIHCKRCQMTYVEPHDCFIVFQNKIIKEFDHKLYLIEQKFTEKINKLQQYYENKLNQITEMTKIESIQSLHNSDSLQKQSINQQINQQKKQSKLLIIFHLFKH